ncbi:copper chaperone PCu(A)C [Streptomyces actinomycinicus]|uniref:Copper chaperone PCu(A)C n=1 Tax=Streptomyces actinomycinicus TaxID=1695166 RepID=A0A937EJK6_9ACTN|nr:copper chaperone PCu(A)C [Streptomyces actinomycinicus]MBL1083326.1 copper chaperone PCu(A)C [Streptomyces actinomycinicus]
MRRCAVLGAVALAGALALTGCSGSGSHAGSGAGAGKAELSVSSSYMPQPVSADMAAGFLTITNKGGAEDELTSVSSDVAGEVTMHSTVGGAMAEKSSFAVPAHGRLVFRSGGNHLMFEQLKRAPKQGQKVTVKLTFAKSGPVTVEMPVESATYHPSTGH